MVESKTELSAGEPLTMDFGPDKTDAQVLLDYGVLDDDNPRVRCNAQIRTACMLIYSPLTAALQYQAVASGSRACSGMRSQLIARRVESSNYKLYLALFVTAVTCLYALTVVKYFLCYAIL